MANLKPISTKQFLVTIDGLQAYFTKASAPKASKGQGDYNDGQTGITRTHVDFIKWEAVTLSKSYDPVADIAVEDWALGRLEDGGTFSVSIQPVNADQAGSPIAGSRTLILVDCQLAGYEGPSVDRDGSGMAMITLEIIPGTVTIQ